MGGKITENLGFKFQHVFVFSHFWIPIPHAIWIFMEGEGDEIKSRQGSWNFLTLRIKMSQLIYQNRITSVLHGFCGFKVLGSFHWIDWWPKTIYVLNTKCQQNFLLMYQFETKKKDSEPVLLSLRIEITTKTLADVRYFVLGF